MKTINKKLCFIILKELKNNNTITQKELASKYNYAERTIRRYYKILKDNNIIKYVVKEKNKKWLVTKSTINIGD